MIRRRGTLSRRTPVEWGCRVVLAIAAAWIGQASATHAFAYMIRGSAPVRAHAMAPGDGRITALMSEALSGPQASSADRARADTLSRTALLQDPTAVAAVATLGIDAQIRGDTAGARRIFAYSETLSRRDLRTRLWAIEDAVARGDVPEALRNYDIALRTSRFAADLLFPVLASAITEAPIRTALVRTIATRPGWAEYFIGYVSGNGPDVRATGQLFEALQRHGIARSQIASTTLIARLLAAGHVADGWRYYAAITPGADRRRSRDPDFRAASATPSPFDWTPVTDGRILATIQRGERGGILDFAAPPNVGGPVVRQAQLLPPGDYVLEGRSTGIEQAADAHPYWTLTCGAGRELGRVPVSNRDDGRFTGRFAVPATCPLQQLTLVARPSDQMSGGSGQITMAQLRPARD